jgi:chromosome partitioning protein
MITTIFATKSSTKTSIAVSAAVYLKNKGVDVLLCDLDSQKSAVIWMEYRDADQLISDHTFRVVINPLASVT